VTKSNDYVERTEKQNFINSAQNGGKMAEMQNNLAKSGMAGRSELILVDRQNS